MGGGFMWAMELPDIYKDYLFKSFLFYIHYSIHTHSIHTKGKKGRKAIKNLKIIFDK